MPPPETRTALILLSVPAAWTGLDVATLIPKLRQQNDLIPFLAREVKRCLDKPDVMDPRKIAERLSAAAATQLMTGEQAGYYLQRHRDRIWNEAETGDTLATDVTRAYMTWAMVNADDTQSKDALDELVAAISMYAEKKGGGW